jgi:hypothetical protein
LLVLPVELGKTGHIKRIAMPMALLLPRLPRSVKVRSGSPSPDLRYLWLIADRYAQRTCSSLVHTSVISASGSDAHSSVSHRLSVHEVLIAIYEAVNERVLGRTYVLQAYPEYQAFFFSAFILARPPALPASAKPQPPSHLFLSSGVSPLPLLHQVHLLSPASDRPGPASCHGPHCFVRVTFCW